MADLKIHIRTPDDEWSVAFQQPEIIIGRGGDFEPDIQVPDATVSRYHGRIWLSAGGYWYEDTNSSYGSKKNGAMIMGTVRVFTGDIISVGESTLTIEQADIGDDDPNLNELFDVQIQDRLNLHQDSVNPKRPSAKVKIIAQRDNANAEPATELSTNFFGNLVALFEYEDQLNDCLTLAIEDIVRLFNPVERGAVLLLDSSGSEISVVAHYPLFEPAISTSLIRKTIEQNKAFIWKADQSSFSSYSVKKLRIKTGLYAPLAFGPHQLGVVCADTTSSTVEITGGDLELFVNITQVLSALIYVKQMEQA